MDPNRFDALTRSMSTARSRRGVLRALGTAALGAVGVAGLQRGARAAQDDEVGICHRTGDPAKPSVYITVSPDAVAAHAAHGDTIAPDFTSDADNCGACGIVCGAGHVCRNGGCFATCIKGRCGPDSENCGCTAISGVCVDYGTYIDTCDVDSDCPAGSVCDTFLFSSDGQRHLCTQSCPGT